MRIKDILPIFDWLPNYKKDDFKGDFWAGLTVGVMLIPQGMAYAMIAGLPPIYGLYAAFLPQVIYSFFGTSRQLSVAPAAMISLLIVAGISEFATQGSEAYIGLAILLAMIVGILQLLFGLFRLGFIVNFLSLPVISGYTSSAAIIIGLSQLKHLMGVDMSSSNLIHEIVYNMSININQIHAVTLVIGLVSIVLLIFSRKISRSFPGPLIIVIIGIVIVTLFSLDMEGVKIIGSIPGGLPDVSIPEINFADIARLFPLALLISLVSFMESYTIGKVMQSKKKNYNISSNKELIGLGMANISSSIFGAFPVSGGLGRTAVNQQSGANTNLASWISAALVGLTLLFFTPLFYNLPKAILAAIIMVAVFNLIDVKRAIVLFKTNRIDFAMLLVTFLSTLFFGVQAGIITGVVLSLIMVIHRSTYPHLAELGKLPSSNYFRNLTRFPEAIERKDALIFRFDSELYFANINYFRERLNQMITKKGAGLKVIILNAQSIHAMDSSAALEFEEIIDECKNQKVEFYLTEVIGPVRDTLRKSGLFEKIGEDHFKMRIQDALDHFDTHKNSKHSYAVQTNN